MVSFGRVVRLIVAGIVAALCFVLWSLRDEVVGVADVSPEAAKAAEVAKSPSTEKVVVNADTVPSSRAVAHTSKFFRSGAIFGHDLLNSYSTGPPASRVAFGSPEQYHHLKCPELFAQHTREYVDVLSRVRLNHAPSFKMPWYYEDREALCGRFLLSYFDLVGGASMTPSSEGQFVGSRPSDSVLRARARTVLRVAPVREVRDATINELRSAMSSAAIADAAEADVVIRAGEKATVALVSNCAPNPDTTSDVLVTARLVGEAGYVAVDVVPLAADGSVPEDGEEKPDSTGSRWWLPSTRAPHGYALRLMAPEPGHFALEVKVVHVNGSSDDPREPRSLGVIGIRASDNNRKSFKYNAVCDSQRHVYGSPLKVLVVAPNRLTKQTPFCTTADHRDGRWVPFTPSMCATNSNQFCRGDPSWLSDACGYNVNMLWAPHDCKFNFYTPPQGPTRSCLMRNGRGFLLMIGDSVTREYGMNCNLFNLRDARLLCLFNNIALEGQHYSSDYARAVVKVIIDSVKSNRASIFATNLGIHHMIGPCTTAQWVEFVDTFVASWKASNASFFRPGETDPRSPWQLEVAVWLGPPTIQYARKGMGAQRAALWDHLAWERLAPLGFKRLYAIAPTRARQEGTWDGLHYASEKGKVQSPWRNRNAPVLRWNGGIANMLFTMLLNVVCNRPELDSRRSQHDINSRDALDLTTAAEAA